MIVSGASSTPASHALRLTAASPGRRRIRVDALLGDEPADSQYVDVDVAQAPVVEDEAKTKLRKLWAMTDHLLAEKVTAAFGRLAVEKRKTRLSDLKEFPRYVIEYLINQFCPGNDFDAEIADVRRKLAKSYASPADAPRILHELKQRRRLDLIGRIEVRLETSEDKYWASLAALNERYIHVSESLINKYPRLMGGMWGIAELSYDEQQVWKSKVTPLVLTDFTPFQHGRIDIKEFQQARAQFTRDEWMDLLLNTAGLNPASLNQRQKLLILMRLVPMAERMVHLIKLGPRETGKSYGYKNLSYYSYMLSGGRATPAALFVHGGTGKPHWSRNSTRWCSTRLSNTEFKDPTATVSVFKDYMEYGNFSLGRFQVKGEASIVFIGNIDVLGSLPHEKYEHLFEPLPEELVDTAFFERISGFLPGWEMPKLDGSELRRRLWLHPRLLLRNSFTCCGAISFLSIRVLGIASITRKGATRRRFTRSSAA